MAVKHVDVREAHRLVGAEAYTYVDVRSIPEYEQGHPGGCTECPTAPLRRADASR